MVVLFEFLNEEAIDNVITCMNFKIDKVIYFGYHDIVSEQRKRTSAFLKNDCGVSQVVFHELSPNNLRSTAKTIRTEIERERKGNKLCFDITGGESLICVAFGRLSKEFDLPLHLFDIQKDKLIELCEDKTTAISGLAEQQKIPLTPERLIRLHGGVIDKTRSKCFKNELSEEEKADVRKLLSVEKEFPELWNPFSKFLQNFKNYINGFTLTLPCESVREYVSNSKTKLNTPKKLTSLLDSLGAAGALQNVIHTNGKFSFTFKNTRLKEILQDGGSVLELATLLRLSEENDYCGVGVHLDWDGKISTSPDNVLNEIDVLAVKGNIPTFVSCKSGKMINDIPLQALYELQTVADRFGGKYAKKVLVSVSPLGESYTERAKEMGIELFVEA